MPYDRLRPNLDVVFKLLFSSPEEEDVLIALLTAVLSPEKAITHAQVLNPDVPKEDIENKGVVMDIRVQFDDGTQVGVEMQTSRRKGASARWLYYWARNFGAQLKTGQAYTGLNRCISVLFLNYTEPGGKFHGRYHLLEDTTGHQFSDLLELHTLELPRLSPFDLNDLQDAPDKLECWARFLTSNDPQEIAALKGLDPMIQKAEEQLEELSADPEVRRRAEERHLADMSWYIEKSAIISESHAEGRAEGIAAGIAEGRTEGVAEGRTEGIAEGRTEGIAQGHRDGVALNIRQLCRSFEIELTDERVKYLADPDIHLDELFATLLNERRWPGN